MQHFIEQLVEKLNGDLPGERAHSLVMPLRRPSYQEVKYDDNYRDSAVSILLHPSSDSSIRGILIQRPKYDGTHSGQVAFPGGKMETEDPNLEYTARRECFEEIGFPIESGTLIGSLTQVVIPVSKFVVYPYVFWTDELPELIPDEREVDHIFSFDIFELTESPIEKTSIPIRGGMVLKDMPYFPIDNKIVWGATALMLSEFREIIRSI